jgi:hypothetical protein
MRYKDIRIVEANLKEAGSYEGDAQTFCRAIKRAASNKILNPNGLARLRAAAEEHVRLFPQDRDMINKCFADGGEGNGNGQGNGTGNASGNGNGNGQGNGTGNASGNGNGNGQGNGTGKGADNNIATDDGATANGGGITGIPGNQNNTNVTGDGQGSNKLKAAADELSRLLDKEDWQGANDLIKGDPNLQALLPDELISDLDAAIQAEADAKAADTAEEQRLADEVEEKRNDAIKADAARIAAKVADDKAAEVKAEKKAEASRIEAERLEQELEQQQTNPGFNTRPTSIPDPNQPFDASDWGDDQSLKRFPVSELNAARSKYYVNLTREDELFFNTDGSIRSMTPIEQRELDALERERKELLKKYGDGILMIDSIDSSIRFVGGDN